MEKKNLKGYFPTYTEKAFHKYLLGGKSIRDESKIRKKTKAHIFNLDWPKVCAHTAKYKEQHSLNVKFNSSCSNSDKGNSKQRIAGLMTAKAIEMRKGWSAIE